LILAGRRRQAPDHFRSAQCTPCRGRFRVSGFSGAEKSSPSTQKKIRELPTSLRVAHISFNSPPALERNSWPCDGKYFCFCRSHDSREPRMFAQVSALARQQSEQVICDICSRPQTPNKLHLWRTFGTVRLSTTRVFYARVFLRLRVATRMGPAWAPCYAI